MADTCANLRVMEMDASSPKDQGQRRSGNEFEKQSPLKSAMRLLTNSAPAGVLKSEIRELSAAPCATAAGVVTLPAEQEPVMEEPDVAFNASLSACLRAQAR